MAASDGGHVWPGRASDARIQEIDATGKPDAVFAALRVLGYTGSIDDMWKQHKAALGITDTSEPFTASLASGSPSDITGLELWLDAQDAGTITVTGSGVSSWTDKSGNSNDVGQATDADRPTQSTVNGKNGITFAASDLLELASASVTGLDGPDITVYVVYSKEFTETDNWPGMVSRSNTAWTSGWRIAASSAAGTTIRASVGAYTTNFVDDLGSPASGGDAWKVCHMEFENTAPLLEMFLNNTTQGTDTTGSIVTTGLDLVVGNGDNTGSYAFVGDIGEVIVYNKILTAEEKTTLHSYLQTQWGVTMA